MQKKILGEIDLRGEFWEGEGRGKISQRLGMYICDLPRGVMDGSKDGQTLFWSCDDASKKNDKTR